MGHKRQGWLLALMLVTACSSPQEGRGEGEPMPNTNEIPSSIITSAATAEIPGEADFYKQIYEQYHEGIEAQPLWQFLRVDDPDKGGSSAVILNYSDRFDINPDSWRDIDAFMRDLAASQPEIRYTPDISFTVKSRPYRDRLIAITPAELGPWNLSNATAASTEQGTSDHYIIYISDRGFDSQDPDAGDIEFQVLKGMVTEACQVSAQISSEISGTDKELAVYWANMGQEIFCNSLAIALRERNKHLPYEEYLGMASVTTIGPNPEQQFPVIVFSPDDYELLPIVPPLTETYN